MSSSGNGRKGKLGREVAEALCQEKKTMVETIDKAVGIVILPRGKNFKLEPKFVLLAEEKFSTRVYVLSKTKDSFTILRVSFYVAKVKSASRFVLAISKACAGHDSSLLTVSKSRLTIGQFLMLQSVAIENPFWSPDNKSLTHSL